MIVTGLLGTPLTVRLAPTIGLRKTIAINMSMMCGAAIYSTIVSTFLGLVRASRCIEADC